MRTVTSSGPRLLVLLALTAMVAMCQSPCGTPYLTTVPAKSAVVLGTWGLTGQNLNLTCAYATVPGDKYSFIRLSIACGASSVGPYFTFPVTSYVDYVNTPTLFTCPWANAVWSTVAYNPYGIPVAVYSVADGYINAQHESARQLPSPVSGNGAVRATASPTICGTAGYNKTIAGQSSAWSLYWLSYGTSITITCFGLVTNTASYNDVAIGCSPDASFNSKVVLLSPLPQWTTTPVVYTCPFSGYFAVFIYNKATNPVFVTYSATGSVNGDKSVRAI